MTKYLAAIVAAIAMLCAGATAAEATVPGAQDLSDAKRFARAYWEDHGEFSYCGSVSIRMRPMYLHMDRLGYVASWRPCRIWLNSAIDWSRIPGWGHDASWWQTCLAVLHEWGHLWGIERPHVARTGAIMAPSRSYMIRAWWWPHHPACRYQGDGI